MMALSTHQLQGSCCTFPSVPSSWNKRSKPKHVLPAPVGRKDRLVSLKCRSCSSGGASLVLGLKSKVLKVSAFKGGSQNDDSDGRANGSKSIKKVKVSYLQHESDESPGYTQQQHDSSISPKVLNHAPYSAADEKTTSSLAIQNLFKNWLMLLRTPSQTRQVEESPEKPHVETSEMPKTVQKQERGEILKAAWCYFLGLDATIKIPLLMFTPLYLGVNLIYGKEVSKELTPLWVLGPLIVALYVKMFQAICVLYVFSFKKTVKIVKNLPSYSLLAYEYIFRGKLNEALHKYLWQPLADIKNKDYKEVLRRKLKDLQTWLVEKYLDYVESIWPYYCRTIRFLKRANLI